MERYRAFFPWSAIRAAYEFHVGNGSISPMVEYDFLEDAQGVVYAGVAIGFAF